MISTVRTLMLASLVAAATTALANDPASPPEQASPPKLMRMGGCKIEEVKPEPCPDPKKAQTTAGGLEKVSMRLPLEPGVAGAWALEPAGSQTGIAGTLVITEAGRFRWTKDGKAVGEGSADEVKPPRGAKASARYWRVANGKDEFYFHVENGALTLYSAKEHAKVATGTPQR